MKKFFIGLAIIVLLIAGIGLGCLIYQLNQSPYEYETREELLKASITSGDFVYINDEIRWIAGDATPIPGARIITLSETGKQKEVITIPKEIDGIAVIGIGIYMPAGQAVYFDSIKTKKIFIPWDVAGYTKDGKWTQSIIYQFMRTTNNETPLLIINMSRESIHKSNNIDNVFGQIVNSQDFSKNWIDFIYNYNDAPNAGCYYYDVYDLDDYITPPPQPIRDGYVFDGWYKEKECTQAFDFAIEVKGDNFLNFYAKWTEIK